MIRKSVFALAAIAAAACAGSAAAAEVRVSLAGKSAKQIHAEILKAANTVCAAETRNESLGVYLYPACVRTSVRAAVAKASTPGLIAYSQTIAARYALASR